MSNGFDEHIRETQALIKKSNETLNKYLTKLPITQTKITNRRHIIINDEEIIPTIIEDKIIYFMGNCIVGEYETINDTFKPFKYILYISTKEECSNIKKILKLIKSSIDDKKETYIRKFKELYKIEYDDIFAFGDIRFAGYEFLNKIIPNYSVEVLEEDSVTVFQKKTISKCYAYDEDVLDFKRDGSKGNVIKHESLLSSWKCLMEIMKYPEYVLIIKEYYDNKK